MKIIFQGNELDYNDDEGLKSACTAHAINVVAMIPSKEVRAQLASFFSDMSFLLLKAQGVQAFAEARKFNAIPLPHFAELITFLRAALGEAPPTVITPDSNTAADPAASPTQETLQ